MRRWYQIRIMHAVVIYQEHVSSIPAGNRHKLKMKLDFEHEGSNVHLEKKIADSMINWREKLATPLGVLSKEDVHTITFSNQNQRIPQQ